MPLPLFFKEYANSGSNNYANAPVPVHRDYANANDYVNAPRPAVFRDYANANSNDYANAPAPFF